MGRQLRAAVLSPFARQRLGFFVASDNAADLAVLTGLVESGQVHLAAVGHVGAARARGKVVVEVSR